MRPESKPVVLSLVLYAIAFGCPAHGAEFYKWVDEDGNTVYSRTPPPGEIKADIVKAQVKADTENATKAMQEDIKRLDSTRDARIKKTEEEQQAKADIAASAENCKRSRTRLSSYSVPNARIIQEDGSQLRPDEETRQQKIKEAQAMVDEWCK